MAFLQSSSGFYSTVSTTISKYTTTSLVTHLICWLLLSWLEIYMVEILSYLFSEKPTLNNSSAC